MKKEINLNVDFKLSVKGEDKGVNKNYLDFIESKRDFEEFFIFYGINRKAVEATLNAWFVYKLIETCGKQAEVPVGARMEEMTMNLKNKKSGWL